jgi:hypothetical protein
MLLVVVLFIPRRHEPRERPLKALEIRPWRHVRHSRKGMGAERCQSSSDRSFLGFFEWWCFRVKVADAAKTFVDVVDGHGKVVADLDDAFELSLLLDWIVYREGFGDELGNARKGHRIRGNLTFGGVDVSDECSKSRFRIVLVRFDVGALVLRKGSV